MLASAGGILRATQSKSENACSAVETVFPPGAFKTMMPRRVAVSTSTLSTPTPARPTTRSLLPAFKISAVTLVWLRTTSALNSGIISSKFAALKFVCTVTFRTPSRTSSSTPLWEMESAMRIFGEDIQAAENVQPAYAESFGVPNAQCRILKGSAENQKTNRVGQLLRDICGNAASEQFREGGTLRCADDEVIDAHGGGKIEDRRSGIFADRVNGEDRNVALGAKL